MVNSWEQDECAQLGPDLSGRALGNWRLLRRIGVGAFGAVYAAENRYIDKQAAVKVLHPHLALHRDLQQRFLAEAGAASKARHPGIVEFYDGGFSDEGLCYMVMELLHGTTLYALLDNGPLSPRRTARLGARLADALAAVHRRGVVHRDLKPENVLLQDGPQDPVEAPKILDFGIAKLKSGPRMTVVGITLGTPEYMSPEQWQMLPDIDGRADAYSLGAILYECLTGQPLFACENVYQWQMAHLTRPPPDPKALCPQAPPRLCAILLWLLAKAPADRPQDLSEVAAELADIAASLPVESVAPALGEGGARSGRPPRTSISDTLSENLPMPRRPLWLAAGIGSLVMVPVLYLLSRPAGPERAETRPPPKLVPPAPTPSPASPPVPARPVRLTPLVTIGEFRAFVETEGVTRKERWPWSLSVPVPPHLPMNNVSAELAARYCRHRNGRLPRPEEAAAGAPGARLGEWIAVGSEVQARLPDGKVVPVEHDRGSARIGFRCALLEAQ